jgi:uncharacterized protein YbjT (DUF2867 family)
MGYHMPDEAPVHVIGASGRSGAALCRALLARGTGVVPVVRDAGRWAAAGIGVAPRIADLRDAEALSSALGDAARVASCAHARHAEAVLAAAGGARRLVFLGSTRKFTRWPDAHGNGVLAGEAAVMGSGRAAVMLHPTMIYGAQGENNVRRLAALLRRLPVVPLPGGGRALVQPVHQSDVTAAVMAALDLEGLDGPLALVVAGPRAVTYADFVRAVAAADGQRPPRVMPAPAGLLAAAGTIAGWLPFLPRVGRDEIRRLVEDKAFEITMLRARLGIEPLPLAEGLARTFQK